MTESVTKIELHLLCRAAASGRVCPENLEETEIVADLVCRGLLHRRFWFRHGAAGLTKAGWAVIDKVYDDDWAN
jgi:hypothetical protein